VTESNPRLGRGLSALLGGGVDRESIAPAAPTAAGPDEATSAGAGFTMIPIDQIVPNPGQPRRRFDDGALEALAISIQESGLLQPVVVRPADGGKYELIAGERRWQASKRAGVAALPAVIREADARVRLELALVENVVREDLNPMELARGVAALVEDFGRTHESVATTLGRSRPAISNLLRLLELPESVTSLVEDGSLSEGHARAVLMADGAKARRVLAERAVKEGLSVRQVEAMARATPSGGRGVPLDTVTPPSTDVAMDVLYGLFEVPVRVRPSAKGPIVELRFPSEDALMAAMERLRANDA
jgi:ParB family chromosome partitioning protein